MSASDAPAARGTGGVALVPREPSNLALEAGLSGYMRGVLACWQAIWDVEVGVCAPSPAEAERDALHARELAVMAEALSVAEADAARAREERDQAEKSLRLAMSDMRRGGLCHSIYPETIAGEALAAAEADLDGVRQENDRLRALLAASDAPCPHCALEADRMAECARGIPGCARADDMMAHPAGLADLPPMPEPDPERAAADDPVPEFDEPATPDRETPDADR